MRRLLVPLAASLAASLALAVAAAGCGGDDDAGPTASRGEDGRGRSALSVRLDVDEPVRSGAPVTWRVVVGNALDAPVAVRFLTGKTADVVLTGGGRTWRWSDGRMFTEALRDDELPPGEIVFELNTEALNLPPGTYEATPELATDSAPRGAPRTIEVVAG